MSSIRGRGPRSPIVEADQAVAGQRLGQLEGPVLDPGPATCSGGVDRPAVDEHRRGLQQRSARPRRAGRRSTPRWPAGCAAARAGPPARCPARPARSPAWPSSASGSSSRMRAAASSIASGRPSRRRQISATAAALPSVRAKSYRTARARSTKSATAGVAASSSIGSSAGSSGSDSGRHRVLPLGPQPQHRPAGGQDRHARAAGQQLVEVAGDVRAPAPGCRGSSSHATVAEPLDQRRAAASGVPPGRPPPLGRSRPGPARARRPPPAERTRCRASKRSRHAARQPPRPAGSCRLPPGPVSVTSRTSGLWMQAGYLFDGLLPSDERCRVAGSGQGSAGRRGAGPDQAPSAGPAGEPLAQQRREVGAHQPAPAHRGCSKSR